MLQRGQFVYKPNRTEPNRTDSSTAAAMDAVGGPLRMRPPESKGGNESIQIRNFHARVRGMDAFAMHKRFVNDYLKYYGGSMKDFAPKGPVMTDYDMLRKEHRFVRNEEDDMDTTSYETRLAKKYYDKLFKEYCIADMTRYKEGKVGLRWRVEKEVIDGKGQFECGNKACQETEKLHSYEVNFAYKEAGEKKNALVKLRLCPNCAEKMFYKKRKSEAKRSSSSSSAPSLSSSEKKRRLHELTGQLPLPSEPSPSTASAPLPESEKSSEKSSEKPEEEEIPLSQAEEGKGTSSVPARPPPSDKEFAEEKASEAWKSKPTMEKTRDEEFEDYFRSLFP